MLAFIVSREAEGLDSPTLHEKASAFTWQNQLSSQKPFCLFPILFTMSKNFSPSTQKMAEKLFFFYRKPFFI